MGSSCKFNLTNPQELRMIVIEINVTVLDSTALFQKMVYQ